MMGKLAFDLQDDLDTRIAKIEKRLRHLFFRRYSYMNTYKDEKWPDKLITIEKEIFTNQRLLRYIDLQKAENDQP